MSLLNLARGLKGNVLNGYYVFKSIPKSFPAWIGNALHESTYQRLTEGELRQTKSSDTVFVFGSGYSINSLSAADWQFVSTCNTLSLREFPRQQFVRADYHMTGEVDDLDEYARPLRENPLYANTIFVVQGGWRAYNGNNLIGRRLLRPGSRIFRFFRFGRGKNISPSESFSAGVVHGFNSMIGATNFAYLMGWKTIVLVGVDLYDKRYFWLPSNETRSCEKPGLTYDSLFANAQPIVTMFGDWTNYFSQRGVRLMVQNPRSLLAQVMPVYTIPVGVPT